ncbi:MAG: methylated-DNA--[protein]-cysteine S-methyltransferase [Chloroflexota bacterium]
MIPGKITIARIMTPTGIFGAVFTERGLACLTTSTEPLAVCHTWARRHAPRALLISDCGLVDELAWQLTHYFEGGLRQFTVPLDLHGTPFQLAYWNALISVPYGETRTYAEMARLVGRPTAVRAIGAANGANPIAIIVPCHRIIGSNGHLTGYAGGLPLKRRLLDLETVHAGSFAEAVAG